jgi:HlyD family secretion protein
MWDPAQKIKFSAPKRVQQRPGVVFVLDAQQKPQSRKVVLGITDGSATEVISGEVQPGDMVIIGDSAQTAQAPNQNNAPPFFPGFGRGGGGGGGRGRGF